MKRQRTQDIVISKQALTEGLLYTVVWTLVLLIPILYAVTMRSKAFDWNSIQIAWGTVLPYFVLFILHNAFISKLLNTKKYWWYTGITLSTVVALFGLVEIYQLMIGINPNDPLTYRQDLDGKPSLTNLDYWMNVLLGIFLCGMNAGIKMIFKSFKDDQAMEVLKRNTLQAELDYLKYQINPHFFMNTLNNIHALIDFDSEAAKNTVIELSKMMRYVLYDSERNMVPLRQEINFMENYISLMKLRFTDSIDIKLDTPQNDIGEIMILPLIFIVFIENAFKHGVSYCNNSFIHINIKVDNQRIIFISQNSKHLRNWKNEGGLGLDNVRT